MNEEKLKKQIERLMNQLGGSLLIKNKLILKILELVDLTAKKARQESKKETIEKMHNIFLKNI